MYVVFRPMPCILRSRRAEHHVRVETSTAIASILMFAVKQLGFEKEKEIMLYMKPYLSNIYFFFIISIYRPCCSKLKCNDN